MCELRWNSLYRVLLEHSGTPRALVLPKPFYSAITFGVVAPCEILADIDAEA
jgi:hypothetical protein